MMKFLSYLFLLTISVGLNIAVMMYGWGLHPRSWWWIIGVGIVANTVIRSVFERVEKESKSTRSSRPTAEGR